jgi:hypothetical protein
MTRIVKLGAPSLTGKDANQLVAEAFADAKYPLTVTVKNHMPRDVVFPEVPGLFLKHVAHATESVKTVKVASHDLFQRLASSVEQIAELNRYELALTISDGAIPTEAEDDDAGGEGSGTGTGGEGGETVVKKPSEGLSYDQLKDALKAKGIAFQANAKKADLAALLDAAPAAAEGDEKPAGDAGGEGSGAAGDANGSADGKAGGE